MERLIVTLTLPDTHLTAKAGVSAENVTDVAAEATAIREDIVSAAVPDGPPPRQRDLRSRNRRAGPAAARRP
jgi:hypothetical protein